MSDKSKLGFNINPKNYDELNSTDSLITSGSDSGWLGKKLQGDDSNGLDLSKINPLFDKDLYEKYRPGVNTNDGSVNQDIWGYKCFNSPVSFRNGIYGDTYSIKSIEGIEDKVIYKSTYNGVSTAVNDKSNADDKYARDNVRYSYNLTNEFLTVQEKSYIASTYTGKLRRALNSAVRPTYDLFKKEPRVYGSSIENETSASGDIRTDCFWLYTYCNPDKTKLNIYNGINAYSSNSPTQYINERNEINIASTIFNDDNTGTTQDTEHAYSESRVTVGTNCKEDIVIKDYTSAAGNCIRMYSTNGRYRNAEYINDNISSIIITPEIINTSVDNKIITIDYHTDKLTGDDYNYSKPVIDIAFDYTKVTDDPANLILFQMASLLNIQDATVSDAEDAVPSINVHGIFKNGHDDIIKYRGTRITPTSIAVNAIQFNRFIMGDTFISNIHNKLVPVEYIFKQNDNDKTGINTYGLKLLSCDGKLKTSFICDYLVVNESIKYKSTISYTDRLVYIDPKTNNTTNVLTVQSNNLILPRGNKEVTIGSTKNQLNEIYVNRLNGTADKAKADEYGHNIAKTYFDKNLNNTITGTTTISRPGDVLRILPNSLDEEDRCSINIATSDVDMRYKTTLNVHQQDNTNLACSLSLYAYHNNDVSSFSILPYVENTTSGIVYDNVALNIGGKNNYFTNIYCKNFPTVHNTLIGHGVSASGSLQTSIGCIRLLCVEIRPVQVAINEQIRPGFAIRDGKITIDGNEYPVYLAGFDVDQSNIIQVKPISDSVVTDSWYSLSGIFLAHNTKSYVKYIPILAIRSY